jgi:hypothetical protein
MRYKNPTPNPLPASEEGAKMYLIRAETAVYFADNLITIGNKIWINFPSICYIKIALPFVDKFP